MNKKLGNGYTEIDLIDGKIDMYPIGNDFLLIYYDKTDKASGKVSLVDSGNVSLN